MLDISAIVVRRLNQTLVCSLNNRIAFNNNILPVNPSNVYNKHYEVPHNVSSVFTGREDICQQLTKSCLPSRPVDNAPNQKRFVLYGLGGSGKTQVCLKFAQTHRERYAHGI